jgi:hypothetical protein
MRVHFRYRDFHPETIRFTSEHLDFDGFWMQIRDMPDEGEGSTGPQGLDCFSFGYRPSPAKGRSIVSFDQAPGRPLPMNRIKLFLPPRPALPVILAERRGPGRRLWPSPGFCGGRPGPGRPAGPGPLGRSAGRLRH